MTASRLYLDHNATTPLRPEARAAMLAAMDLVGSASSIHTEGRAARRAVEAARAAVAGLVGAAAKGVVFTSGASEANALALTPHWQRGADRRPLDRCLVCAVEHASVLHGSRFAPERVEVLPVDGNGLVDLAALAARLAELQAAGERPLVSVMLANNETGVIQPVAAIAALVHETGGILHTDAAQAAGKIEVRLEALGADLMTLSSHKIGGPFGAGALVLVSDALHLAAPLVRGGGQERGARAGTENVPALAGFGAAADAARAALPAQQRRQRSLRERLEAGLRAGSPDVAIFGDAVERLPNTVCHAEPGVPAETALIALDLDGIAVSSGSACSSGKVRQSHVLAAMGVDNGLASGAIRVSLGSDTSEADIDRYIGAFNRVRTTLHARRKGRAA